MAEHKDLAAAIKGNEKPDALVAALSKCQGEFPQIKANTMSAVNDAVMPVLTNNGFAVYAKVEAASGIPQVVTSLRHVSGNQISTGVPVADADTFQSDVLQARLIGLCCLLNVVACDDGNAVSPSKAPNKPKAKTIEDHVNACGNPRDITRLLLKWAMDRPVSENVESWEKIFQHVDSRINSANWNNSDDRDKMMEAILELEKDLKGGEESQVLTKS